jgi:hypothetical protein
MLEYLTISPVLLVRLFSKQKHYARLEDFSQNLIHLLFWTDVYRDDGIVRIGIEPGTVASDGTEGTNRQKKGYTGAQVITALMFFKSGRRGKFRGYQSS